MSCAIDNNAFEIIITPSRKRKRGNDRDIHTQATTPKAAGFTNAAYSSTPKKEIKSLIKGFNRFPPSKGIVFGKENQNNYPSASGLEVKSISELVNENKNTDSGNPFEIIRKPPKKKKKPDVQDACFVNPGLNLELPEQQFNPFEVKRDACSLVKAEEPQCFVNPGLNIRSQDTTAARNPFEIPRTDLTAGTSNTQNGIENLGLNLASGPLSIGIPFKPSIGIRIDFSNMTPSKMLADKLVLSPINKSRVLSDISEEEATMDIGRELDLYQLELENSINEAKQKKTTDAVATADRLDDIAENPLENETNAGEPKTPEAISIKQTIAANIRENMIKLDEVDTPPVQKPVAEKVESIIVSTTSVHIETKSYVKDQKRNESFTDDEGIDYDDDEEEDGEIDFKAPAPFVRAYRRPDPTPHPTEQYTELPKNYNQPAPVNVAESKSKVKDIIRKSIRKLIHSEKAQTEENTDKKTLPTPESTGHHFMEAIRHSLRRRPQKTVAEVEITDARETSIIDTSERRMKLKSNLIQTDYIKIEELTAERKSSLRSSIKKSTRDVKNQIMKSVFHKNKEEYAFAQ